MIASPSTPSLATSDAIQPPHILLGITGGIAAYKAAELVRLMKKAGYRVQVVMTDAASRFVTPVTLQALSGEPVLTDLWDTSVPDNMAHISLTRKVDAVLIAPASADFLAKLALGLCNDLLSTLCLARNAENCQLFVAPAMNREMWEHPATQRNVRLLCDDGTTVLGPAAGEQACGEVGLGRMLEPEAILTALDAALRGPRRLHGLNALVTAGPTFEAIDPVRGLTNSSSGKMGYAIAAALLAAGARVTLVSGPVSLSAPLGVTVQKVRSANEMLGAVNANLADVDLFFAVAAVADYTPTKASAEKIKKSAASLTLELTPTVDILASVAARPDAPFCVGFAAESENVVEYAAKKREKKRIPLIVANHANSAIGADDNEVTLIDDTGIHPLPRANKTQLAVRIVAHAANLYLATRPFPPKTT